MTSSQEAWTASRQALRDVTEHPEKVGSHENAIARFLAGAAYADQVHESKGTHDTSPQPPADSGDAADV